MRQNQLTNTVVMVSPCHFGFNPQTAETNPFQHQPHESKVLIQKKALEEFTKMVDTLKKNGIRVLILPSREDFVTPDSIFPNNWFSHHQNGKLILYPMLAPNRRAERQPARLKSLLNSAGIPVLEVINLSADEKTNYILEGTGSLVLDREHKVVFAMESPRTTKVEFDKWCEMMGYEGVFFKAYDAKNFPIYHTNVTMNIGYDFAVVCLESIKDQNERSLVENKLRTLGKEVVAISVSQMYKFCGNVLQLLSVDGKPKIVMSETACSGFTKTQLKTLKKYGEILAFDVSIIEKVGGGSARCMLAEVFPIAHP